MAIKHATVVTLPNNANKQVSATAWNSSHVLEDGTISDQHVSTTAAVAESKLALNYPTHSNSNDPSSGQKAAMNAAAAPSGGNPFATLADVPAVTAANNMALQLALCPRVVYFVYGDSTDGGVTPDTNTQSSIDALLNNSVPQENIIWIYTPNTGNGSFTFVSVTTTPTVTPMTLTGIAAGYGNYTHPSVSVVPTITPMTLVGARSGSFTYASASLPPTVVAMSLTAGAGSTGSYTQPAVSIPPSVTAMSLSAASGSVYMLDTFSGTNGASLNGSNWNTSTATIQSNAASLPSTIVVSSANQYTTSASLYFAGKFGVANPAAWSGAVNYELLYIENYATFGTSHNVLRLKLAAHEANDGESNSWTEYQVLVQAMDNSGSVTDLYGNATTYPDTAGDMTATWKVVFTDSTHVSVLKNGTAVTSNVSIGSLNLGTSVSLWMASSGATQTFDDVEIGA